MLGDAKGKDHNITICIIVFELTQTALAQAYLNVTDGETDGQTDRWSTCLMVRNSALCVASRSKNAVYCQWKRQLVKRAVHEMEVSPSRSHPVTWPTRSRLRRTRVRRSVLGFFKVNLASDSLYRWSTTGHRLLKNLSHSFMGKLHSVYITLSI